MHKFFFVIFTICTNLLYGQESIEKTATIEPYLQLQNYEHFKRLVLISKNNHIEYIDGFDFEWGYEYTLKVLETKLETELSDGTRYEFELKEIITKSSTAKTMQFKLRIDPLMYYQKIEDETTDCTLRQINDSTYSYFEEVELVISENVKAPFLNLAENLIPKNGTFNFIDNKRIRLLKLEYSL